MLAATGIRFARIVNTRHGMGIARPRSRREWLYRRALRGTDYVVAVCEAARTRYASQQPRTRARLLAVPNGIRIDRFAEASASTRARLASTLDLGADARVAGTVGRLDPVKDQAMLLRAFSRVHEVLPRAALLLIGDGALRGELETLAGSLGIGARVRFLGDRDDVPDLLGGLDLFVLPSRSEGYSIALLEACASGLPIVATDVGGNREIVEDRCNGRLVPAGDERAFAEAMRELLDDPVRASRLGRAGREWAKAQASLQAMAERYQRLYDGAPGHEPYAGGTAS
jgi:glycosyltransferase involved in cell wall biosynthesis